MAADIFAPFAEVREQPVSNRKAGRSQGWVKSGQGGKARGSSDGGNQDQTQHAKR